MSSLRPAFIEELRAHAQKQTAEQRSRNAYRAMMAQNPANHLFHHKTADDWLKEAYSAPDAAQLLGTLWHQGELCILFADTNLGKSIFATQIGYSLAKNGDVEPFANRLGEAVKVLYIDFELSPSQFKTRYSERMSDPLNFGENFIRAAFNPQGDDPILYDDYSEYVRWNIEDLVKKTKAKVLIIDNITCMGNKTGNAAGALPLMKGLKALKSKYGISLLVLAHTPKRNPFKPITVNDLQGSKMLINFADSAFALGQSSQGTNLRYLKQIKQRNTANDYGEEHVCLFRIVKEQCFLQFQFVEYNHELANLQKPGNALSDQVRERIIQLHRQGLSQRQAAMHLKISSSTVCKVVNKWKEGGKEIAD